MALLCGYMRIRNDLFRLVAGCVLVPVLFWLAGSITVLFAGMVCLFEGLRKTPKWYISLIGVAEVLLLGVGTVYFSLMGEYRWVFGPDLHYHYTLHPKEIIYYSWICLPSGLSYSLSLSGIRIVCPGRNCLRGSVVLLNWL